MGEIEGCDNINSSTNNSNGDSNDVGCLESGNAVLEDLGMPEIDILPTDIAGLAALVILYHFVAFLVLRWRLKK